MDEYNYFGFPVCYRIEHRASGETLILSFRPGRSKHRRIVFEGKPKLITKARKRGLALEEIVLTYIPEFLLELFDVTKKSELPKDRQRETYELPLAVVWELDKKIMEKAGGWKENTRQEYEQTFKWIISQWGQLPLGKVTPEFCANRLQEETTAKHKRVARALRQLFYCEAEQGFVTENPWENPVQGRREPQNRDYLAQVHIADYILPKSYCQQIVSRCFAGLTRKVDGGLYFGVLLCMVLALNIDEVTALTFGCFSCLAHYPARMVVNVSKHLVKKENNWTILRFDQAAKIRKVAMPTLIKNALEIYKQNISGKENEYVLRSPKNADRRITPDKFKKWLNENFGDIVSEYIASSPIPSSKSTYEILHQTALAQLDVCGYEEEEARYVQGKKPKATHAKHYCDFANEAELNRMGALLERTTRAWTAHIGQEESGSPKVLSGKGSICQWKASPESRGDVNLIISIPVIDYEDIPDNGIQLEIAIPYGGEIRFGYEEAA